MTGVHEHEGRLRAVLDAYPQGYSTDNQARYLVKVRADDLRQLLGDVHAYRETCRIAAIEPTREATDQLRDEIAEYKKMLAAERDAAAHYKRAAQDARRWPGCNFLRTDRLDACHEPGGCLTSDSKCAEPTREAAPSEVRASLATALGGCRELARSLYEGPDVLRDAVAEHVRAMTEDVIPAIMQDLGEQRVAANRLRFGVPPTGDTGSEAQAEHREANPSPTPTAEEVARVEPASGLEALSVVRAIARLPLPEDSPGLKWNPGFSHYIVAYDDIRKAREILFQHEGRERS